MSKRAINFNAGPSAIPLPAMQRAQEELLNFEGSGMSVMEHSHRGKLYEAVHNEAVDLIRSLLKVPDSHDVLLLQGGARGQFAMVPMNLLKEGSSADYIITGSWSEMAYAEATVIGSARQAANTKEQDDVFRRCPSQKDLELDPSACYVHLTSNNTIFGTQFHAFPDTGKVPLVADMSSDILSRPIDVSRFGLIYAGAQKNIGPSGVTAVIIRKDLVESGCTTIPKIFQYGPHAKANSLLNTPPTFAIYMMRNVLRWIEQQGGLAGMKDINEKKAALLYDAIAKHPDVYRNTIPKESRSVMNVVFNLKSPELEAHFVAESAEAGMSGLKGHRSVGGIRASIYNAVPVEHVQTLVEFMDGFAKKHS